MKKFQGRAVQSHLVLDEALNQVFSVNSELPIELIYENALIHLTGPVMIEEPLTEPDYNIQVLAVKLRRRVQMYQWVEETVQHNYGGVTDSVESEDRTYYYVKEWKDKIIDSRSFYISTGHHNPTKFSLESTIHVAENVIIGHYEMGSDVKTQITGFIELTSDTRPEDSSIKLHSGLYYHCDDIWNPVIGDIRVQFSYSGLENEMVIIFVILKIFLSTNAFLQYTVIGQLKNGKIGKFDTSHGRSLIIVKKGTMSVEAAIKAEHQSERITTWGFRFFGWVLLFFAATCTAHLLFIFRKFSFIKT